MASFASSTTTFGARKHAWTKISTLLLGDLGYVVVSIVIREWMNGDGIQNSESYKKCTMKLTDLQKTKLISYHA